MGRQFFLSFVKARGFAMFFVYQLEEITNEIGEK